MHACRILSITKCFELLITWDKCEVINAQFLWLNYFRWINQSATCRSTLSDIAYSIVINNTCELRPSCILLVLILTSLNYVLDIFLQNLQPLFFKFCWEIQSSFYMFERENDSSLLEKWKQRLKYFRRSCIFHSQPAKRRV